MAIDLTAYASTAEYRERNGRVSTDSDTMLTALLTSVSRVVDRRLGVSPGMFKAQTTLTYTVKARGGTLLRLRDERGEQLFLRTVDTNGIDIDTDRDGTFDGYQLDLADAWVRGYPVNASTMSAPFTALELLPGAANADPLSWADGVEVRITGTAWGWATTPGAVKERVIGITRELVQVHLAGPAMDDVASAIDATYGARSLMYMLEQEYNYRVLV